MVKSMRQIIGAVAALFALSTLCPQLAHAQSVKTIFAQVGGQVLDPDGHPIAGANVRLEGSERFKGPTDASGRFVFANVSPGIYTIIVDASGYNEANRSGIAVLSEDVNLDIALAPVTGIKTIAQVTTSARSSINVSAAPSYMLTPTDMSIQGQTQWRKVLEELPGVSVTDDPAGNSGIMAGSPLNSAIVSIRGALQYETAMLIDNMPMYATTSTIRSGNGADLAQYNPQSFSSFDVIAGPGAQSPSIVGSIGGSLNLHPAGQVTKNRYEFSIGGDPFGGWIVNGLIAERIGKLSATATYGFDDSPGPAGYGGTQMNLGTSFASAISAVNGVPFVCNGSCSQVVTYPTGATAGTNSGLSGGLLGCCLPSQYAGWRQHDGSLSLFYQPWSPVIVQFFASANNEYAPFNAGITPVLFTPPATYAGSLAPGVPLDILAQWYPQPASLWTQTYEGKLAFQLGQGQLQLAALSNYSEYQLLVNRPTSVGMVRLYGGGSECLTPPCTAATLTPVVFDGSSYNVSTFPETGLLGGYHAHNRDESANYAIPLGSRSRATASYVHSYYDYSLYQNITLANPNGVGGSTTINSVAFPQSNFEATDQVRLGYGLTPSDNTSFDLSYYLTNSRFHVLNPADTTKSTYVDQRTAISRFELLPAAVSRSPRYRT